MSLTDILRREPCRPTETGLDEDEVYELLVNERRRWVVEHLADIDGPTTIRELGRALAFIEAEDAETPDDLNNEDYKARYVSLYQTHLPRLERYGIVDVERSDTVCARPVCRRLANISREVRRLNGGGGA